MRIMTPDNPLSPITEKIQNTYVITNDAIEALPPDRIYDFVPKKPENGANVMFFPEGFLYAPPSSLNAARRGADRTRRSLLRHLEEKKLQVNTPMKLCDGLYGVITNYGSNASADKPPNLPRIHELVQANAKRINTDEKSPKFPIEVISESQAARTYLSSRGYTVGPIRSRRFRPERLENYVVQLDPRTLQFAELEEKMNSGSAGESRHISSTDFFAIMQDVLPKDELGNAVFLPNQYFIYVDGKENWRAYRNSPIAKKRPDGIIEGYDKGIVKELRLKNLADMMKKLWTPTPAEFDIRQLLAIDACINGDLNRVFLLGKTGGGKTSITEKLGVAQVINHPGLPLGVGKYQMLHIGKTHMQFGGPAHRLGILPGDPWEKLSIQFRSYIDSHRESWLGHVPFQDLTLHRTKRTGPSHELPENPVVELLSLDEIAGANISLGAIDEIQNAPEDIAIHLSTRGKQNSKIIFAGDHRHQIYQSDYDETFNGVTIMMEAAYGRSGVGVVVLEKSYRDLESQHAAEVLRGF